MELTSPEASVSLAISALLLVIGFRLAHPARSREWLAVFAYAAALAAQFLGTRGGLPGGLIAPGIALRIVGAALLVVGLVVAGSSSRARRRAAAAHDSPELLPHGQALDPVHAGLALVLVGQLLRGPSVAGGAMVLIATAINLVVARTRSQASQ